MSTAGTNADASSFVERGLAEIAEELTRRLQAGEPVDLEEFLDRHPRHAEELRQLLPALERLADLGCSGLQSLSGAAPPLADHVPGLLGDYRLLREVGRGGMGVVYEAEQVSLGRRVALKILPTRSNALERVRRFEREARAAGRLHHTNIVPVFGFGREGTAHYYVMQFIDGQPLDEVLSEVRRLYGGDASAPSSAALSAGEREAPSAAEVALSLCSGPVAAAPDDRSERTEPALPPSAARSHDRLLPESSRSALALTPATGGSRRAYARNVARIGAQVAYALDYAAAQGVLHRDIKPSNLLLDVRGTVWVTDFGLAKTTEDDELTQTGDLLGTLRYLAPERFRGVADPRGDVYSLGLTLYELLALRPAFEGSGRDAGLRDAIQAGAPRLSKRAPWLPRDLATIVQKAVERDPADRYQSAGALAEDLGRYLDDLPIAARRPHLGEVAWRWCRRNPVVTALLAAIATGLVGGTAASVVAAGQYNRLALSEGAARQTADRRAAEAQLVVNFLINDLVAAASPERKLGRVVTVDDALSRADEAIDGQFAGQPLAEASIRHTLGITYAKIARLEKAERHLARARELRAGRLGPEHADTLASTEALALVLRDAGRWAEARVLLERVLESRQRRLGEDHPDTLSSMDLVALLLSDRVDLKEAQKLFERVYEARRRVLGPEATPTLDTMNDLAIVLRRQGHFPDALALQERVLEARRRVLGPEHPLTLDSAENVAHCFADQERLEEALFAYERVYEARRRVLGPEHRDTVGTQYATANMLAALGRWSDAEARYERVIEVRPDQCEARFELAALTLRRGDIAAFRRRCETMVADFAATEKPVHAELVCRLCALRQDAIGDPERALPLARQAAAANPEHAYFLLARGALEYRAGRPEAARAWLAEARKRLPPQPARAQCGVYLAMAFHKLGRLDDARAVFAEAERIQSDYERAHNPATQHPGAGWRDWLLARFLLDEARTIPGLDPSRGESPPPPR